MARQRYLRTVAVITVSDKGARGEREDLSGPGLRERLAREGYQVVHEQVVADEMEQIEDAIRQCADRRRVALVLTTGGTGVAPRDITPEATLEVIERQVPGIAEAMRAFSLTKTPHAMLSRAVAGIRGQSLVINLPGSPRAALENLEAVIAALGHALDKIQGDPSDCAQG